MQRHAIPTAAYAVCRSLDDVRRQLPHFAASVVVKADGLAAGKGVVLCNSHAEAEQAATEIFPEHSSAQPKKSSSSRSSSTARSSPLRPFATENTRLHWPRTRSQAHRPGRHRPQHRRHGGLHRGRPDERRTGAVAATERSPAGRRSDGPRRLAFPGHSLLRHDDGPPVRRLNPPHGPRVQRPLRRPPRPRPSSSVSKATSSISSMQPSTVPPTASPFA